MYITNQEFNEVYASHHLRLLRAAYNILRDFEYAQDVVQECFMRLTRQEYAKIKDHLTPWLFTVCRNLSLKHTGRNKRYLSQSAEEFDERVSDAPDPAAILEDREQIDDSVRKLYIALDALQPQSRKVIELRYMTGLSYKEIAQTLKITEGNVGFIISNTTNKLKKIYSKIS